MLPYNSGSHAAYQDTFVSDFLKFYPDPFALPKSTWDYIVQFWYLDLSLTDSIMQQYYSVLPEFRIEKLLLDSAHDAYAVYAYCRRKNITPLSTLILVIPDTLPIRTILPLVTTGSPSVSWAYVCIKDDYPRLFNIPPRDSNAWEKESDKRTSVERSNKREKEDHKIGDGSQKAAAPMIKPNNTRNGDIPPTQKETDSNFPTSPSSKIPSFFLICFKKRQT